MGKSPATLTIDLGALKRNYRLLVQKVSPQRKIGAAVKANAYGLGVNEVSTALFDEGCRDFFVSSLDEGVNLRRNLAQDAKIYVLNGFYASRAEEYATYHLIPALGSFMEIEAYKKLGAKTGEKLPAYLSFNTRMNRLGLGSVETEKLLGEMSMLDGINVIGILSHFACADEAGNPMNDIQYNLFNDIAKAFPNAQKSLCNSSGIFRDPKYHFDLARSGMALYGLNPTPETTNPMEPVVRLEASVVRVRLVYKDTSVGYNATYRFDKNTWLATLAVGYADGISWHLSNKGVFYWKGYPCPIRGRVSMDLTTIDLSAVPEGQRPKPGDVIEILGPHQSANDLAKAAGTIGYEILTSLGSRYERRYIET